VTSQPRFDNGHYLQSAGEPAKGLLLRVSYGQVPFGLRASLRRSPLEDGTPPFRKVIVAGT